MNENECSIEESRLLNLSKRYLASVRHWFNAFLVLIIACFLLFVIGCLFLPFNDTITYWSYIVSLGSAGASIASLGIAAYRGHQLYKVSKKLSIIAERNIRAKHLYK